MLEAAGGDEALVLMRDATPPHLVVVLDLLMRQGTGFDVLAARHRVIVCSAFKDSAGAVGPHFAALLARLGAAFVAKPFDIDALLARVWTAERALAVCRSRRGPRATHGVATPRRLTTPVR